MLPSLFLTALLIFPRFHLPVRNIFCRLSELLFLVALVSCALFSSALCAADFAGDVPVVRVGYFKSAGYHEIVNDSEGRGYGFDFYNLLQRYANIHVEYVGYDKTWPEMQAMLERGEIDVLGPVNVTPERKKLFAFSRNIGTSHSRLTAHIGTIAVASTLGRGSVFTVKLTFRRDKTVPVAPAAADEGQLPVAAKLKDCRILLAEDNDLNAEIALEILKQSGVAVRRARDGEECVRILSEAPAGAYDAVLMDIQMPKMDGYAATEAIRRLKDDAKRRIPVIALTANAFTEDEQKARDAGMDAFVAKPIDFEKLLAVLAKFTVRA